MVDPKNTPTQGKPATATTPAETGARAAPSARQGQESSKGGRDSNERTVRDLPQTVEKVRDDEDPARTVRDRTGASDLDDTVESRESREYAKRFFDPDTDKAIPIDETTGEPYKPGEVPPGWNQPVGGEYRGILKDKMDCDAEYAQQVADEAREKAIDERERLSNAVQERMRREREEPDPGKKGEKEGGAPPSMEGGKKGSGPQGSIGSNFETAKK